MWARSVHQLILEASPVFSSVCWVVVERTHGLPKWLLYSTHRELKTPKIGLDHAYCKNSDSVSLGGNTVRWPAVFVSWLYLGDCLAILATILHKFIPAPKDCHGAILYIFFLRKMKMEKKSAKVYCTN